MVIIQPRNVHITPINGFPALMLRRLVICWARTLFVGGLLDIGCHNMDWTIGRNWIIRTYLWDQIKFLCGVHLDKNIVSSLAARTACIERSRKKEKKIKEKKKRNLRSLAAVFLCYSPVSGLKGWRFYSYSAWKGVNLSRCKIRSAVFFFPRSNLFKSSSCFAFSVYYSSRA